MTLQTSIPDSPETGSVLRNPCSNFIGAIRASFGASKIKEIISWRFFSNRTTLSAPSLVGTRSGGALRLSGRWDWQRAARIFRIEHRFL